MEWDQLRVFLAVARAGTLEAAARELAIDRTTVGRRIAALEAQVGALFSRSRAGLRLTHKGERAFAFASRMDGEARGLAADLDDRDARGVVRLAVTEAMAPFLIQLGLMSACRDHAGLRLEILAGNRRLELSTGEADLALRADPLRGAALHARCLFRSPIALWAARDYLAARRPLEHPAQLAGHAVLLPAGGLAALPEARWLAAQPGVVPVLASDSFAALVAAARAGHGLVPLPTAWGDREPPLVRIFDVPGLPLRALWLVSTDASRRRPACVAVARLLVGLLARR